ncbi:MAG: 50S ribosomal protein L15 [Candidatus Aminicenantes bacterium]|nr:50S ribosomal protein L15 [Candidatus Aminicenantes bacterium]
MLNQLQPARGSRKNRKRVGRGPGSGHGKTSGRGHKGQKSITGFSQMRGFEGGQMPLHRRLPKRGFTNKFRQEYTPINLDQLEKLEEKEITIKTLVEKGLIKNENELVKILGRGEIKSPKIIHGHKFSASARGKIEAIGGQAIIIGS